MAFADLGKLAALTTAAALPVAPPATTFAWGPSIVELFGVQVPVASMILSLIGLAMARGVSSAREKAAPGGRFLTGALVMICVGAVLEGRPGPGMAIAWGIGIGASGIVIFDLLKDRAPAVFVALFGREKEQPPHDPRP